MPIRTTIWLVTLFAIFSRVAVCEEPMSLIDHGDKQGGWRFDNGREFPGAKGQLVLADEHFRDQPVLSLRGDFTEGGNYVQAAVDLPDVPMDTLSFWIDVPAGTSTVPIRLIDGTKQCHQLRIKLNDKGGWQKITLPVEEYFRKMGTAAALDVASQYENWSGANDARWHQPGKLFVVLFSRNLSEKGELRLSDVQLHPAPIKQSVQQTIRLDEMLQQGELDWGFNLGQEFRGAQGGVEIAGDPSEDGKKAMRLHADFTEGGAYVGMRRSFESLAVEDMPVIRLKMRSDSTTQFALRLVDATGQCHQRKGIKFNADGKWHEVAIEPSAIAGGEHWGGANDGKWHPPVKFMELMLNTRSSDAKKSELLISSIQADVIVEATAGGTSFHETFDSASEINDRWEFSGDVQVAARGESGMDHALRLQRSLDRIRTDTTATSKAFRVSPGAWQVQYMWKSGLHSPDNSYHGAVELQVLGDAGRVLESIPIGIGFGKSDWQDVSRSVSIPNGATHARLHVQLRKTYGTFDIDDLSVSQLKLQPIQERIDRILLRSEATGNLFQPGDEVLFCPRVEANKLLPSESRILHYRVCDYWGAEQIAPAEAPLQLQESQDGVFRYGADIVLPPDELEVGRYYELHVSVPQDVGGAVNEYCGFAILPIAPSKEFSAEEIPFTIRNWDSRIPAYFHLADRLGLRMLGVWGGWSARAPYKPHCPRIELCEELGAKWITGTPAADVERNGFANYSEEALRKGMRNFLEEYADQGMAMIAMGNEPHGTGKKVLDNVRAYRAIYETVKAFDDDIHVMGTSVEPNEEYFRAGYQNYLDSYDFHIYEHYTKVRRTMQEYRELMEEYDAVKPIHSTELGLNSQGQTRLAVSREMIKKITSFFAEGGDTVSWFTIQYSDPQGKARGQFGDSHCMFDCKYNLFNPRLDAVTHYHLLNAVCVKRSVQEKHYESGAQSYLFLDDEDRCLQVLWLDGDRKDVFLPLGAAGPIQLIHIDGCQQELHCADGGVTLTLSDDPVMLLYKQKDAALAEALGEPRLMATVDSVAGVSPGGSITVSIVGEQATAEQLKVIAPPMWKSQLKNEANNRVQLTLSAPSATTAREARVMIQGLAEGTVTGEVMLAIPIKHE